MQEVKKVVLLPDEAASFLGIKKNYLYQLTNARKIPFYRPSGGRRGRIYFKQSELEEYLFRNRQPADSEGVS